MRVTCLCNYQSHSPGCGLAVRRDRAVAEPPGKCGFSGGDHATHRQLLSLTRRSLRRAAGSGVCSWPEPRSSPALLRNSRSWNRGGLWAAQFPRGGRPLSAAATRRVRDTEVPTVDCRARLRCRRAPLRSKASVGPGRAAAGLGLMVPGRWAWQPQRPWSQGLPRGVSPSRPLASLGLCHAL